MVDPPLPGQGMAPQGDVGGGAEGTVQRMRRGYALAAAEALVEYLMKGFRFAIRTVGPGERIEPDRAANRVVFTLPDWAAYTSLLGARFNAWWQRTRAGSSQTD